MTRHPRSGRIDPASAGTGDSHLLDRIARGRYLSVTTFRRDGRAVPTPVGFVVHDGELLILTPPDSGKVKRIRHDNAVVVAPCDMGGRIAAGAPSVPGRARVLDRSETPRVRRLMSRRYPVAGVVFWWDRLLGRSQRWIGVAITL